MASKLEKETAEIVAERVETMVCALCKQGFTKSEAVSMVCSMLSSAQIYLPFETSIAVKKELQH